MGGRHEKISLVCATMFAKTHLRKESLLLGKLSYWITRTDQANWMPLLSWRSADVFLTNETVYISYTKHGTGKPSCDVFSRVEQVKKCANEYSLKVLSWGKETKDELFFHILRDNETRDFLFISWVTTLLNHSVLNRMFNFVE